MFRRTEELVVREAVPKEGSEPLFFPTQYARSSLEQFRILLLKFSTTYWRLPEVGTPADSCAAFRCLWCTGRKLQCTSFHPAVLHNSLGPAPGG